MKVIDLLNKIANGEEIPKRIKINDLCIPPIYRELTFDKDLNLYINCDEEEYKCVLDDFHLNNEIEIIEDNEIKKLENINSDYYCEHNGKISNEEIILDIETLKYYINEIIDRLNGDKNDNGRI